MHALFLTTFATGVTWLAAMFTGIAVARILGPELRGVLAMVIFWPSVLTLVASLSIGDGLVSSVSRPGSRPPVRRLLTRAALWLDLILFAIGLPLLLVAAAIAFRDQTAEIRLWAMVLMGAWFARVLLEQVLGGNLRARNDYRSFNLVRLVTPFVYAILVGLLLLTHTGDLESLIIAQMLATLAAAALVVWLVRREGFGRTRPRLVRLVLRRSLSFHPANVLFALGQNVDRLLVILTQSAHAVGLYVVALFPLSSILVLVSTSAKAVFIQKLGPLPIERQREVVRQALSGTLLFVMIATIATVLLGPPVVRLAFGPEYEEAATWTAWLAPGVLLGVLRTVLTELCKAIGKPLIASGSEGVFLLVFAAVYASAFALSPGVAAGTAFLTANVSSLVMFGLPLWRSVGPHVPREKPTGMLARARGQA